MRGEPMSTFERRRVVIAAALTVLALPALWWAKRDDPIASPSAAAIDAGGGLGVATGSALDSGAAVPTPGYLDGSPITISETTAPVVGPDAQESFKRAGLATFKQFATDSERLCQIEFLPAGARITIENTDNGKKVTCLTSRARMDDGIVVVIDSSLFAQLSDLAEAPIPVRIRW